MNRLLTDTFNRNHTYLRLSITDRCDLRCTYCMPEGDHHFKWRNELMNFDEIVTMATLFVDLGINKIRLTGGEPLVRKDAGLIIEAIAALPVTLTLTTNGVRLNEFIDTLLRTGVKTVNISLDTLKKDRFARITRRDSFDKVIENIRHCLDSGIRVKLNVVLMKGVNDDEIIDFISLTKYLPIEVRFIEYMPFEGNQWTHGGVVTYQEILDRIAQVFSYVKLADNRHDTAKKYGVPSHKGSFAIIGTMTAPFCSTCNRLRVTADGKLKNCLFSKTETDLLTPLREGKDLLPLIRHNLMIKEAQTGGQFTSALDAITNIGIVNRSMISIGG